MPSLQSLLIHAFCPLHALGLPHTAVVRGAQDATIAVIGRLQTQIESMKLRLENGDYRGDTLEVWVRGYPVTSGLPLR